MKKLFVSKVRKISQNKNELELKLVLAEEMLVLAEKKLMSILLLEL